MTIGSTFLRRPVRGLLGVLVAGAAWTAAPAAATAQVSVDALEISFAIKGTESQLTPQTFRVSNDGTDRKQVTINAQDWDRSETGENRYSALGTLPASCNNHVKVFPSQLQLEPGASAVVRVWVDTVASVASGCYTILFIETPRPPASTAGTALRYTLRYGVKVYVEPDVAPAAEVVDAEIVKVPGANSDSVALAVTYRNSGARQTIARGQLEVRRADNSVVHTVPIAEFPTLPGATRRVVIGVPKLPSGQYVLLALLDYRGADIAAGQAELLVP